MPIPIPATSLTREEVLHAGRDQLEAPLWRLVDELEKVLKSLLSVPHFDMDDPTAVGAAIHSALPQAAIAAGLDSDGIACVRYPNGPSNKLEVQIVAAGRQASLEVHYSGPRGGTSKTSHQFAEFDIDGEPDLPGFDLEAPRDVLLFLAYALTPARTKVARMYLTYADGIDRKKIELHRPVAGTVIESGVAPSSGSGPVGTKVSVKKLPENEESGNAGQADKWGDAASSS